MRQFSKIRIGQGVLVLGAAETSADRDVLTRLHKEFYAFDRGDLWAQLLNDLIGGQVALVMRL